MYSAGPLNLLDRVYLDAALVLILGAYSLYVVLVGNIPGHVIQVPNDTLSIIFGVAFVLLYLLTPWLLVSAVKRFRERNLLKSTLAVNLLLFVIQLLRKLWLGMLDTLHVLTNSTRLNRLVVAHIGAYIGGCVGIGLFSIFLAASGNEFPALVFILVVLTLYTVYFAKLVIQKMSAIEVLSQGTAAVKAGRLNEKIPMTGVAVIDSISNDINNLADGMSIALRNEIKAEHMKVELITNVSHDLKTPLTSIINYADLLSKENLTPDKANEYVQILQQKSARLKHLVEDLFEMSKANSGTGSINLEPLSLNELLSQAIGEYEEKFLAQKLELRVNPDPSAAGVEKVMILADSARMWRVLSNLMDNINKYSMESARVYLDWGVENGQAWFALKNISKYEMNFPVHEITERFKQGDASRNAEGSGLGLAIVESFMKLQGGKTEITVDGDLFKVLIRIPLAQ